MRVAGVLSRGSSPFTSPRTTGTRCEPVTSVLGRTGGRGPSGSARCRRRSRSPRRWWCRRCRPGVAARRGLGARAAAAARGQGDRSRRPEQEGPAGDDAHAGRVAARWPEPRRAPPPDRHVADRALGGRQRTRTLEAAPGRCRSLPAWPARSPSWSTDGPSRCPTTAARCSRCCATGSASARPRTAAARRASAAAARCWSTAQPRVACVTPARRVAGRHGHDARRASPDGRPAGPRRSAPPAPASAGSARRGSSCGWPALRARAAARRPAAVDQALLAHLCRCTGWQTIGEAALAARPGRPAGDRGRRDLRAPRRGGPQLEGGTRRSVVGPEVALGRGGFADDTAPADALVAVRAADGAWVVGETLTEARAAAGKVQGRRTTARADAGRSSVPAGRLGAHAAHDLGRARLPRDRTRRGACRAASRPRRWPTAARSAARWPAHGRRGGPASWPTSTAAPVRVLSPPRGRGAARAEASAARRRGAGRRHAASCAWSARRASPRAIAAVAPGARGRGGRRGRPADVGGAPGRRLGRGAPCCSPSLGDGPDTVRSPDGAEATAAHRPPTARVAVTVRCGRAARRRRAALLLHRRRPHGARLGALGGPRRRRRRRAARPHDPLVRHPAGRRHAADRGRRSSRTTGDPVNGSDAVFAAVAAAAWRRARLPGALARPLTALRSPVSRSTAKLSCEMTEGERSPACLRTRQAR